MSTLRATTVDGLGIPVPFYDRAAVIPSVVHLGVGNFHRSHQAEYLDRVLSSGDLTWGICGVGLLPRDEQVGAALRDQDTLYTLVTLKPDGDAAAKVVGSIVEYLFAPENPHAVLERLADPLTRIVTLTITEGGYGVDDTTGEFSPYDPLIIDDLQSSETPGSALGYLVEAIRLRRDRQIPPFTVVSCDNIPSNGRVTRTAITGFARARDPELAEWIGTEVSFPSSMVDRITPVTTDATRAMVRDSFHIDDRCPVASESYLQWVVEDDFPRGRPNFEHVGVQLVDDVVPYELMKLRLLNASHQAMGYLGLLAGFDKVHEVSRDPAFNAFLRRYMLREARPTLAPVPGIDLDAYCDELMSRFAGDAVGDTLHRQVVDGSERLAKFLVPVLRDQLRSGGEITCSAIVLAGWSLYLEQHLVPDSAPLSDRRASELLPFAARNRASPGALLDFAPVFGDLGHDARLRTAYREACGALASDGAQRLVASISDS